MPKLDNKVALITGSDSGMGQAMRKSSLAEGADVAVSFHTDQNGAEATRRQVEAHGRRAIVRQLDVRDESSVVAFFDDTATQLGVPHILVNNAGVGGGSAKVADMTTEEFDRSSRPTFTGPSYARESSSSADKPRGEAGRSSTSLPYTRQSQVRAAPPYGAAKGGLLTFTRSLALELAPMRVNVNAIAPGLISTPMTSDRTEDPEKMKKELPHIPWNRPGEPWEIARLALYLASEDSDYVTGQSYDRRRPRDELGTGRLKRRHTVARSRLGPAAPILHAGK